MNDDHRWGSALLRFLTDHKSEILLYAPTLVLAFFLGTRFQSLPFLKHPYSTAGSPPPPPALGSKPEFPSILPDGIPASAYLTSRQDPLSGLGAVGFVVFTSVPTPNSARNLAICEAFRRNLTDFAKFNPSRDEYGEFMVTYWPVTRAISRANTCAETLRAYDVPRAVRLAATLGKLQAHGPLLVAIPPVQSGKAEFLVLDLSELDAADLDFAFEIWRSRITREPQVWTHGINVVQARIQLSALINRWGGDILSVVNPANAQEH